MYTRKCGFRLKISIFRQGYFPDEDIFFPMDFIRNSCGNCYNIRKWKKISNLTYIKQNYECFNPRGLRSFIYEQELIISRVKIC